MSRCDYCHAEEGEPHACNCWAPNGTHAGEIVIPRSDIAMLIEDNEDLRAKLRRYERDARYDAAPLGLCGDAADEIDALRARIGELEGALERIVRGHAAQTNEDIARAALNPPEDLSDKAWEREERAGLSRTSEEGK